MITNDERGWCYKISHRNSKKPCPFCENEYLRKQLEAVEAVTELPDRTEMYAESGWDVAMRAVKAALSPSSD